MTEVCWRVTAGQVWGLVGSNGCGKSTLLKCIAGQRPASDGTITVAQGTPVGCLEQTAVSGSTRTVWDEARSRMTVLLRAEAALEAAYAKLEAGDAQAAEQLADAQAAYEAAGGLDAEARIASVLKGLGFAPADFTRPASEFSGGWQMRIALARLLLSPAAQGSANGAAAGGLLLLDEPTNHLDRAAVKWLSSFLAQSPATVILVSHDEGLLEQACSHIIEVRGGAAHLYPCSYSKFLQDREQRGAQQAALRRKQQAEADRLEGFISRFGAKATKASQAKSVQKQLDKLKGAMVDAPVASAEAAPGDAQKVRLRLPPPPPCHREVLTLQDVATGWGEPRAGPPLLQGISLTVECGQRIVVLGKNGCGKSTLLRALAGTLPVWEGERRVGPGVEMGVFAQDLAQELPQDAAALDYVMDVARQADKLAHSERGRQSLGALGLSGSAALRAIGTMSGGEKARVALAAFALKPHNLLLLDEASNHLDVPTLQVLTAALQEFSGAVVAITHNPEFARALQPTHVLRVADGTARLSHCIEITPADFQQPSTPSAVDGKAAPSTAGSPNAATFKENDREARARLRKCQNRMKTLERLIEKAEPELERLQAAMLAAGDVNDVEELAALQAKIDTSELRIDEAFDEMEQLEAEIASLKATCHHAS